ncbi:hypothetical protein C5167_014692 [Papaver somniferum]|uniref:Uncharacterized protein n=1 Tax=Papaver somniferum TaxID=3469 RepID=A0A4Y7J5X3_PAPSO|nr:hypothetical protein C5167_014692 [Papaver somniferum]
MPRAMGLLLIQGHGLLKVECICSVDSSGSMRRVCSLEFRPHLLNFPEAGGRRSPFYLVDPNVVCFPNIPSTIGVMVIFQGNFLQEQMKMPKWWVAEKGGKYLLFIA